MNRTVPRFEFVMPPMSWEQPIEQEILTFVRSMARQMEQVESSGQEAVREGAGNYAKAYRTVEEHIVDQIRFRKEIKSVK